MEYYFAYGSNINPRQMKQRCPGAEPVCTAVLPNHALHFPLWSDRWQGYAADVVLQFSQYVLGVVYALPLSELYVMDRYEGVDKGHYKRCKLAVRPLGESIHGTLSTWIYQVKFGESGKIRGHKTYAPSKRYMDTIISGAYHFCFEPRYIAKLQAVPLYVPPVYA